MASLKPTQGDVQEVVETDEKQRYQLMNKDNQLMIRAVQGHSTSVVEDSHLLQKVTPWNMPKCCVHGTCRMYLPSIAAKGLLAGGHRGQTLRKHVHFMPFNPGDKRIVSGMRSDCEIAIWLDLTKALEDKVPFYWSANQVLLSPGVNGVIDKKYFTHARDLRTMQILALDSD
eukprot:Skav227871  [mRNA]  locus=scaffold2896:49248:49763:+ [translate_table: standard]